MTSDPPLTDLEALPPEEWRDMTTTQWRAAVQRTPRYTRPEPLEESEMALIRDPGDVVASDAAASVMTHDLQFLTTPVSRDAAARFAAACNNDPVLMRDKLEYLLNAFCEADAAIREAYRQEGCDAEVK